MSGRSVLADYRCFYLRIGITSVYFRNLSCPPIIYLFLAEQARFPFDDTIIQLLNEFVKLYYLVFGGKFEKIVNKSQNHLTFGGKRCII